WASIMAGLDTTSWSSPTPAELRDRWIQYETGLEVSANCEDSVRLALPRDAQLPRGSRCGIDLRRLTERTMDWLKDVIN
ncbi:MAG TPA: hypothetical protein VMO24_04240, partial [Woeseiaceae bacterium]|nr:hypothetical protein [Woeseiaceae bacterium]